MKNITVSRDKVEQWLEDLEFSDSDKNVIADIKQALAAQPAVQEPVYLVEDDFGLFRITTKGDWNFYNITVPGVKKTLIANATPPAQPAPVQGHVATVIEELEHDGEGFCAKVRWLYNPVPLGETLSWEQPK